MTPPIVPARTRSLLLDAAGAVFAERGYRAATVREICRRAAVNLAAVNYHFGDKEQLYREVLRRAQGQALAQDPPGLGVGGGAAPEERLRAFVHSFLWRVFDPGPAAWHVRLLSLEMIEPSGALDTIVQERFRPMADELSGILRPLLGGHATVELLRLCAFSVVSQCVFLHHCRSVICRLFPEQRFGRPDIQRLADHITDFSLAALKRLAKIRQKRRRTPGAEAEGSQRKRLGAAGRPGGHRLNSARRVHQPAGARGRRRRRSYAALGRVQAPARTDSFARLSTTQT